MSGVPFVGALAVVGGLALVTLTIGREAELVPSIAREKLELVVKSEMGLLVKREKAAGARGRQYYGLEGLSLRVCIYLRSCS